MTTAIPKRFKLHGITIEVELVDNLLYDEDRVGQSLYRNNKIQIQKSTDSHPISPDRMLRTFYHELVHWILMESNHNRENDEAEVELFAALLHQAATTMEWPSKGK